MAPKQSNGATVVKTAHSIRQLRMQIAREDTTGLDALRKGKKKKELKGLHMYSKHNGSQRGCFDGR